MDDNQTIAYAGAGSATGGHEDSVFPPEPPARELFATTGTAAPDRAVRHRFRRLDTRDPLRYCGYKRLDALRICGFNVLLLPVNLAGSISSIVQALTGSKGRFMRTPKVANRTSPAFIYVVMPYILVAFSAYTFVRAYHDHQWTSVHFAAVNAVLGTYAIIAFIGIRDSLVDIWVNVVSWLYKPQLALESPDAPSVTLPLSRISEP